MFDTVLLELGVTAVPSVKIFRFGTASDFMGTLEHPEAIAAFISEDSAPAVTEIADIETLQYHFSSIEPSSGSLLVIGIFSDANAHSEGAAPEDHFLYAAQHLRGLAKFVRVTSEHVMEMMSIPALALPTMLVVQGPDGRSNRYSGDFHQNSLVEFVLQFSNPPMQELKTTNSKQEQRYASQFFSSRKLKFLLLLGSSELRPAENIQHLLQEWVVLSNGFSSDAIFSFAFDNVPSIAGLFQLKPVKVSKDTSLWGSIFEGNGVSTAESYPVLVAYDPITRSRYKRVLAPSIGESCSDSVASMKTFIEEVLAGASPRVFSTEEEDNANLSGSTLDSIETFLIHKFDYLFGFKKPYFSYVAKAVGSSIENMCNDSKRDVLVAVYNSNLIGCVECMHLEPLYDLLARALEPDARMVVAKIDVAKNEIPPEWKIDKFPSLLWCPVKNKKIKGVEQSKSVLPIPFWDQTDRPFGVSVDGVIPHLIDFKDQVIKRSSFTKKPLRIASNDQMFTLLSEIGPVVAYYEEEYSKHHLNHGRYVYSDRLVDYFIGEAVRVGCRGDFIMLYIAFLLGCTIRPIIICLFFRADKDNNKKSQV
jgi:hypothetical protein